MNPRHPVLPPLQSERLLDQVRERVRYLHYSIRTEWLAAERKVAVATHKQALSALLFLAALPAGERRLIGQLRYGTGMRILEGLRLRIKDIDFERRAIVVREGKGGKDRIVMLPATLAPALQEQLVLYPHVLGLGGGAVRSPLDILLPLPAARAHDGHLQAH